MPKLNYTFRPNWTQHDFPQPPWDTPGLPARSMDERCATHKWCAYRDDDPAWCSECHASPAKCTCGRDFDDE